MYPGGSAETLRERDADAETRLIVDVTGFESTPPDALAVAVKLKDPVVTSVGVV
jgi:hypothetical protein